MRSSFAKSIYVSAVVLGLAGLSAVTTTTASANVVPAQSGSTVTSTHSLTALTANSKAAGVFFKGNVKFDSTNFDLSQLVITDPNGDVITHNNSLDTVKNYINSKTSDKDTALANLNDEIQASAANYYLAPTNISVSDLNTLKSAIYPVFNADGTVKEWDQLSLNATSAEGGTFGTSPVQVVYTYGDGNAVSDPFAPAPKAGSTVPAPKAGSVVPAPKAGSVVPAPKAGSTAPAQAGSTAPAQAGSTVTVSSSSTPTSKSSSTTPVTTTTSAASKKAKAVKSAKTAVAKAKASANKAKASYKKAKKASTKAKYLKSYKKAYASYKKAQAKLATLKHPTAVKNAKAKVAKAKASYKKAKKAATKAKYLKAYKAATANLNKTYVKYGK